ncbi:SDR family oxidoreductase [Levilactobacillus bambusae]|uniref:NAD-dependent dehydratase n=1 Tax=Levilactobacillus bambusae TaxID=2024736 RepID=A0A2V1N226_9LACO|nr:SDR family oxidoreductase [Levilactobacillus bambusae]PWG00366.1 NAD-dependent dehydratase [Levilactobacillus bambusae]
MTNVLILGAHGKIARLATQQLLEKPVHLTLFLRDANRLKVTDKNKETIIEGDATSAADLDLAMQDIDVVYANLSGHNIVEEAKAVVASMDRCGVKRLIWISTLGIYDEVPGEFGQWNHKMLDGGYLETYATAAEVIEDSDLGYTIIRPAWLTDNDEIDYEVTHKGDPFKGTEVSRESIAAVVTDHVLNPDKDVRYSIGVNKPHTDGPKPSWY